MSRGARWTDERVAVLRKALREGKTFVQAAVICERTADACRSKASALRLANNEPDLRLAIRPRPSNSIFTDAYERKLMEAASAAHVAAVLAVQPGGFPRPFRKVAA